MNKQKSPRSGFTLIELLTVIAIIGILAAILIPAVGKVREVANKSTSASNMRSIALSYATYSQSGGRTRVLNENRLSGKGYPRTVQGVAQFLGDETDLNDASIWRIGTDPEVVAKEPNPPTVGFRAASGNYSVNSDFTSSPVSYDFIIGVGGNDPATTTPLLMTRGINTSGIWDNETPWGRGGHIAFLDAHVTFYNELDDTEFGLVDRSTGKLTNNYLNAIRDTAELLKAAN
jgi:prepilin-type N-terminal cleavage/methylation domain-containing protein